MSTEAITYRGWTIEVYWDSDAGRWIAQAMKPPEFNLHGLGLTEFSAVERVKGKIDLTRDMGS
jgi:hypothetical protein